MPEELAAEPAVEAALEPGDTIEDVLKQLRRRRFGPEAISLADAAPEEPIKAVTEPPAPLLIAREGTKEEAAQSSGAALAELAAEAAEQTGRVLEHLADEATERTRQVLERLAAEAAQQTGHVLERLAAEAAQETGRVLERLAAEETGRMLEKAAAEERSQSGAALEELSGEVRRVGRELFKANRATEHNQELFEGALAELRQLTLRVEQVPARLQAELYGAESVVEMKAAICRDLLDVADALEASLRAAQEVIAQLQSPAAPLDLARGPEPEQRQRRGFLQEKLEQWGIIAPPADAPQLRTALAAAVAAMSQWRDGQALLSERLLTVLSAAGVRRIEAVGRAFDPTLHRAVSVERRDDLPAGTVIGEERKGYLLENRVLRYAEVIVAKHE
jgi:molecular chaperone GrpE